MEYLDSFICPIEETEVKLGHGQYVSRTYNGRYGQFTEYAIRVEDYIVCYFCFKTNDGRNVIFLYHTDEFSSLMEEIIGYIDPWNLPSVKEQWPIFSCLYENGIEQENNRMCIAKIQEHDSKDKHRFVFAYITDRDINFEDTRSYRELVLSMIDYASQAIEEVSKDNGCLSLKGMLKSFWRGAREGRRIAKIFNVLT